MKKYIALEAKQVGAIQYTGDNWAEIVKTIQKHHHPGEEYYIDHHPDHPGPGVQYYISIYSTFGCITIVSTHDEKEISLMPMDWAVVDNKEVKFVSNDEFKADYLAKDKCFIIRDLKMDGFSAELVVKSGEYHKSDTKATEKSTTEKTTPPPYNPDNCTVAWGGMIMKGLQGPTDEIKVGELYRYLPESLIHFTTVYVKRVSNGVAECYDLVVLRGYINIPVEKLVKIDRITVSENRAYNKALTEGVLL